MTEVDWDALKTSIKVFAIIFLILIALANIGFVFAVIRKWNSLPRVKIGLLLALASAGLILAFFHLVIETKRIFESSFYSEICHLFLISRYYAFYFEVFGYCTSLILLVLEILFRKRIVPRWENSMTLIMSALPWATALLIVAPLSFVDVDYSDKEYLGDCNPNALPFSRRKALEYVTNVIPCTVTLLVSGAVMLYYFHTTPRARPGNTDRAILLSLPRHEGQIVDTSPSVLRDHNNFENGQNMGFQLNESLPHPSTNPVYPVLESGTSHLSTEAVSRTKETICQSVKSSRHLAETPTGTVSNAYPHTSDRNMITPCSSTPVYTSSDLSAFAYPATHNLPQNQASSANDSTFYRDVHFERKIDVNAKKEAVVLFLVSLCFFIFTMPLAIFALLHYDQGDDLASEVVLVSLDTGFMWWFYLKDVFSPLIWTIGLNI